MHKLPELTVSKAVAFGHATVTLPVVGIMSGVGFAVYVFTGRISFVDGLGLNLLWQFGRVVICAIVALIPAWMWWSYGVRRWRNWTQRRGIASESLEKLAVRTLLVWPNRRFENSACRR
jgi:hypothetical protein